MIVEAAVLVLGLVIALIRTLTAPALFPLKILAIVWAESCRGIPTIMVVYMVGFGRAGAGAGGRSDQRRDARRDRADVLLRGVRVGGLPRRDLSVHPSQGARRWRSA